MVNRDKYSPAQRDAAATAILKGGHTYAQVIVMARRGELHDPAGEQLPAFDPPHETVRTWVRRQRDMTDGTATSHLAKLDHRDAVEILRQRLISSADHLTQQYERQVRFPSGAKAADPERLRQLTRVVREAAALPGRNDPRPPTPGRGAAAERQGERTKTGLAADILADVDRQVPDQAPKGPAANRQVPDSAGTGQVSDTAVPLEALELARREAAELRNGKGPAVAGPGPAV